MLTQTPAPPLPSPRPQVEDPEMSLLRAGIPLSLLMDLAGCDPHSRELYRHERAS